MRYKLWIFISLFIVWVLFGVDYSGPKLEEDLYMVVPDILMAVNPSMTDEAFNEFLLERVVAVHRGSDPVDGHNIHIDTTGIDPAVPATAYARVTLTYDKKMYTTLMQIEIVADRDVPVVIVSDKLDPVVMTLGNADNYLNYSKGITFYGSQQDYRDEKPLYITEDKSGTGPRVIVHDECVLYAVPGTYAVRYEIINNDNTTVKNFVREVVVSEPKIPTYNEMIQYFDFSEDGELSCKEDIVYQLYPTLYIPGEYYKDDTKTEKVQVKKIKSFGCYTKYASKAYTKLVIGEGVEDIGQFSFAYIDVSKKGKLKKVKLPNSIQHIQIGAFAKQVITNIVFPTEVKKIDDGSFADMGLLENIIFLDLPDNFVGMNDYNSLNAQLISMHNVQIFYPIGVAERLPYYTANRLGYSGYQDLVNILSMSGKRHDLRYFAHYSTVLTYL